MKNALEDRDPVAWAVVLSNGKIHDRFFPFKWEAEKLADSLIHSTRIIPLYHSPLTDSEREAIARLCEATSDVIDDDKRAGGCHWQDDAAAVAAARGLLERTK